jgi:EAL domain-containing protein (putative c-di-GMP-specific phosphodiesterase class I)
MSFKKDCLIIKGGLSRNMVLNNDIQGCFELLSDTLKQHKDKTSSDEYQKATRLVNALIDGNYMFAEEPWHDIKAAIEGIDSENPTELLLRAHDENGPIETFEAVSSIYDLGLGALLDRGTFLASLDYSLSNSNMPITINITPDSLLDNVFYQNIKSDLKNYRKQGLDPSKITIEITEQEFKNEAPLHLLFNLKALGVKFALDDFTLDLNSRERIETFARALDIVKIDGPIIQRALRNEFKLENVISEIKKHAPNAKLVAEWVDDELQAMHLYKHFNIDAVQGRELTLDRETFKDNIKVVEFFTSLMTRIT